MPAAGFREPLHEDVGARVQKEHLHLMAGLREALDHVAQTADRVAGAHVDRDRDAPMPLDIPSEAITCIYGGESVRCTGVLHARGYLRVKPVANSGLWWFDCAVSRVPEIDCDLVYK